MVQGEGWERDEGVIAPFATSEQQRTYDDASLVRTIF